MLDWAIWVAIVLFIAVRETLVSLRKYRDQKLIDHREKLIRDLLLSGDHSWREHDGGHDWRMAYDNAREHLDSWRHR